MNPSKKQKVSCNNALRQTEVCVSCADQTLWRGLLTVDSFKVVSRALYGETYWIHILFSPFRFFFSTTMLVYQHFQLLVTIFCVILTSQKALSGYLGILPPGCDQAAALTCEYDFLLCKLFNGYANDKVTLCKCAGIFYGQCLRQAGVSTLFLPSLVPTTLLSSFTVFCIIVYSML